MYEYFSAAACYNSANNKCSDCVLQSQSFVCSHALCVARRAYVSNLLKERVFVSIFGLCWRFSVQIKQKQTLQIKIDKCIAINHNIFYWSCKYMLHVSVKYWPSSELKMICVHVWNLRDFTNYTGHSNFYDIEFYNFVFQILVFVDDARLTSLNNFCILRFNISCFKFLCFSVI
jgi:hypothetical protein